MRLRGSNALSSNPALVGAVTVLTAIVATFLAYNANNGLPFVPTRTLYLQLPDGANLRKGEEVRKGGFRIGVVTGSRPARVHGRAVARVRLKLDRDTSRIPRDAHFTVRARTLLGSKYIEVGTGRSRRIFADNDAIPLDRARIPTQLDDVTGVFDGPTRTAIRTNVTAYGDALAGRGEGLNETIQSLPGLLGPLQRVTATLADPRNRVEPLIRALDRTATALAPVADQNAHLFSVAATTFGALNRSPQALGATIDESAPTLSSASRTLPALRPFLRHATALAGPLERSSRDLTAALPDLDRAVVAGRPVALRTPAFSSRLDGTLTSLRALAQDPNTGIGLRGLQTTVDVGNPQLRYLGPFVDVCNYWNYFWTAAADAGSARNAVGQSFRLLAVTETTNAQNGYNAQGATRQANGGPGTPDVPSQWFHGQPGGAAVNTDGTADCEAAQRGYPTRLASAAPKDMDIVMDQHTPGSQGPLFKNLDDVGKANRVVGVRRVPKGQTFSRSPETGPKDAPQPEGGP